MIFDSAQFSTVKPFSYIFFWGGLFAVLYPPYIQIAKWDRIASWVKKWFDKNDSAKNDNTPSSKTKSTNNPPATPDNLKRGELPSLPATGSKTEAKGKAKDEAELAALAEKEKNRTESKQYLNKAPTLETQEFTWKFTTSKDTKNNILIPDQLKDKKPIATEEGILCKSYYYIDPNDTSLRNIREQMYNNVWKHFRSDYRRMNPITKHDGVVEFWEMIRSKPLSQQFTKKKRMLPQRKRPKRLTSRVPATSNLKPNNRSKTES